MNWQADAPALDLPRAFAAGEAVRVAISHAVGEMLASGVPRDRVLVTLANQVAVAVFSPASSLHAEDLAGMGAQIAALLGHPLAGAIPRGRA